MIGIFMVILALFVSSQSANAKVLDSKESHTIWIKSDILIGPQWVHDMQGIIRAWIKYKNILYYCAALDAKNKGDLKTFFSCKNSE